MDKIADILAQQTIHESLLASHSKTMENLSRTMDALAEKTEEQGRQIFMLTETAKFYDGIIRWCSRGLIASGSAAVAYITTDIWSQLSSYMTLVKDHVK